MQVDRLSDLEARVDRLENTVRDELAITHPRRDILDRKIDMLESRLDEVMAFVAEVRQFFREVRIVGGLLWIITLAAIYGLTRL